MFLINANIYLQLPFRWLRCYYVFISSVDYNSDSFIVIKYFHIFSFVLTTLKGRWVGNGGGGNEQEASIVKELQIK